MSHILLALARTHERSNTDLAPAGGTYDLRTGAWIESGSGKLLIESTNHPRVPQTKKNDVETGEDQKGT